MPKTAARRSLVGSPPRGESVWALAVVSSTGQADSLVHQRKWAEDTAASHGWRISRIIEGASTGKAGPRKPVRDLLADLRTMEPEARPKRLLMIRADRLGRGSIMESLSVLHDLKKLGVSVYTREGGEEKIESGADEFMAAAKLSVARIENEVRSDKRREVIRQKRAAGVPFGRVPYGLTRRKGKDVIDPPRAKVVREAFRMRLQGDGYQIIGKRLRAIAPPHRFLNKTDKHPTGERVTHWTPERVRLLLSNRAYVGPIIGEATFAKAQRVAGTLANAPRHHDGPRKYDWPLGGALRCHCGYSMTGMPCGAYPWRYRYYACKRRENHAEKLRLVRAENVEQQFVNLLRRLRASPRLVESYRRRVAAPVSPRLLERALGDSKAKLAGVDRKREQAWELHSTGKVRGEDVQERLDKLAEERDELQSRINDVQRQIAVAKAGSDRNRDVDALFRRAAEIFTRATEPEQRSIARAVAVELGGLHVAENGRLTIGASRAQANARS